MRKTLTIVGISLVLGIAVGIFLHAQVRAFDPCAAGGCPTSDAPVWIQALDGDVHSEGQINMTNLPPGW